MTRNSTSNDSQDAAFTTLRITDFGPISRGTVSIKPLTILFGPNGCGKSHVATLAYTAVTAESHLIAKTWIPGKPSSDVLHSVAHDILYKSNIDENLVTGTKYYETIVKDMLNLFFDTLPRNLLLEHKKLIRQGQKKFILGITSRVLNGKIQYDGNDNDYAVQNKMQLKLRPLEQKHNRSHQQLISDNTLTVDVPHIIIDQILKMQDMLSEKQQQLKVDEDDFSPSVDDRRLKFDISWYIRQALGHSLKIRRGVYFPAERGGLTLAQRSLTLHYYNVKGNPLVSSPDPNLPNVATDFLGTLLMPSKKMSDFADLAVNFEQETIKGAITAQYGINNMPDIVFTQNNESFPINATASSVKDMATFLLYLKHNARDGDLIILEEPETCLHPTNQILLARLLATLVNKGLHVMVTTHGPFFAEQLSHCVVSGEKHARNESDSNPEDLRISQVAAHTFVPDDNGGYRIDSIGIDDEGIPQYEFTRVFDRLYKELLELERDT